MTRVRRRLLVAAGLAIVAVVAVATPLLVGRPGKPRPPAGPPTITVARLGPRAVNGVIAAGTINGGRWQVRLSASEERKCYTPRRSVWAAQGDCVEPIGDLLKRWYAPPGPAGIWDYWPALFGPVKPGTARLTMRLADGAVLNLRPVAAYGHRWFGVVLPPRLAPATVVAYSRHAEIAHSVPFVGGDLGGYPQIDYLSWLQPGDAGPARARKVVRGAGQSLVLHAGPWGNVLTGSDESWSFPLWDRPDGALGGGGGLPRTVEMAFPWPAAVIRLQMHDGSVRRVPLVEGAREGFAIIRAPRQPRIVRWDVYDRAGHRLSGGVGAPGGM